MSAKLGKLSSTSCTRYKCEKNKTA